MSNLTLMLKNINLYNNRLSMLSQAGIYASNVGEEWIKMT